MAGTVAPETLETMRRVGLTEYEARAYHALLVAGRADAATISRETTIPPTRIHSVLRDLERKQWVTSEPGRPIVFIPREPRERLRRAWDEVVRAYDAAQDDLQQAHTGRRMAAASPVWFVRGEQAVAKKIRDVIVAARKQIFVTLPFLLEFDDTLVFPALRNAAKHGRRTRVLVSPALKAEPDAPPWSLLIDSGVEIRTALTPLRQVVADRDTAIGILPREEGKPLVALWNPVREVVQMVGPSLDGLWEAATPLRPDA